SKVKIIGINHGFNPKHLVGTDLAISLNQNAYQKTIELGQSKNKSLILHNYINVNQKNFSEFQINRKQNDQFMIGSYGRFSFEKGYDVLIEALKILNDKKIDFQCYLGGSGNEENNLKLLTEKYNLADKVKFVGWVENKEEFLNKID